MPGLGFNDGREKGLHEFVFSRPDLETSLRGNPGAVLAAIEEYTSEQKSMITFGLSKIQKSCELIAAVRPPPKVLLELGTYVGCSAIGWGQVMRSLHPEAQVLTMELNEELAGIARDLIDLAGLSDVVTVLSGPAEEHIRSLKKAGDLGEIDVLFLDHWQDRYVPDLQVCEELGLFHKGSLVLADNTDIPGAPDYVAYVKASAGAVKYDTVAHEARVEKGNPSTIILASTVTEVP